MAVCNSFLSQLEVYNDSIGLVSRTNTQQHRCILFPLANFLGSALIVKISALLNNPELCQLADEETPTSTSRNLANEDNDEEENYEDISSKGPIQYKAVLILKIHISSVLLENCPTNSTRVQTSDLRPPNLDISTISGRNDAPLLVTSNDPVDMTLTRTADSTISLTCECGKKCTRSVKYL